MSNEQETFYYCEPCRLTGALHCAYPDECGEMDEPKTREQIEAIRAKRKPEDILGE